MKTVAPNTQGASAEVPVLIVGGGPVGMTAAILLARRGVASMVCEKYPSRLEAPKAHALNPRSLEILRAAGLPMDRIRAAATPRDEGGCVRIVTTLVGEEIGCLPYERQDDAVLALTPTPLLNIAQPRLEAILEEEIRKHPLIQFRKSIEWVHCEQTAEQVRSTLRDRDSGDTIQVDSRYLLAADGASSGVRDALGIEMDGPEVLRQHVMIHFEADLRGLVKDRSAVLYFFFGAGPQGALIAYDIGKTWVLMHPFDPDVTPLTSFDEERCRRIVLNAVGADVPDLVLRGARPWALSAQVAERYRQGNAFLVGDAAHRFPPTGGLGLNTGVADADNLTWKIATHLAGEAGDALLDTYERERRHVARTNMQQSLMNAMRILEVPAALGCRDDGSDDPSETKRRLADPESRRAIDAAVAAQADHFDSLRLQLGYVYGVPEETNENSEFDSSISIANFEPQSVVGARLPHVWIQRGDQRESSLDLAAVDRFTLICAGETPCWDSLADNEACPIHCLAEGRDFHAETGSWAATCNLQSGGALLIRPDGHILARAEDDSSASVSNLRAVLTRYLDRAAPSANEDRKAATGGPA